MLPPASTFRHGSGKRAQHSGIPEPRLLCAKKVYKTSYFWYDNVHTCAPVQRCDKCTREECKDETIRLSLVSLLLAMTRRALWHRCPGAPLLTSTCTAKYWCIASGEWYVTHCSIKHLKRKRQHLVPCHTLIRELCFENSIANT